MAQEQGQRGQDELGAHAGQPGAQDRQGSAPEGAVPARNGAVSKQAKLMMII